MRVGHQLHFLQFPYTLVILSVLIELHSYIWTVVFNQISWLDRFGLLSNYDECGGTYNFLID
jgi:hypothetical protein